MNKAVVDVSALCFFLSLLCLYFDCMQIERTLLSKEKITKRTQYSDYTPFNNFDHWCGSFLVENDFFIIILCPQLHLIYVRRC